MNKWIRAAIALAVLFGGFAIKHYLVSTKPEAKKSAANNRGAPVEVIAVGETSSTVTVRGRGNVIPARQVVLGTEVGGKVINIAANLQPGGKFKKGEVIARIDPSDYRIAVEQQFAAVDSAQAQLAIEESRRAVAKREWEMFGSKRKDTANKQLALREPQLRSATTQLKSAKSGLRRARLGVERTLMRAPFDGMVQSRSLELGQIVAPGAALVDFVGTNAYWVQVSLPVERLAWISIPEVGGQSEGSRVTIHHRVGKEHIQRQGRVLRLLSGVDPAGRMARLLVEIDDPLGLVSSDPGGTPAQPVQPESPLAKTSRLPLLLGTYVEVEIEGRRADNVIELERSALRDGDTVYVMTDDSRLEKRKVEVLWRWQQTVLLASGLDSGEKVVISPLATAVDGMKLRIPGHEERDPATEADDGSGGSAAAPTSPTTAGVPVEGTDGKPL